jgi:hypothetical protein
MKAILFILIFSSYFHLYAQDNIIFLNGDEINGKVTEISPKLILLRPGDNPDGPIHSYDKRHVLMIKYADGKKEIITPGKSNRAFSWILRTGYLHSSYSESDTYPTYTLGGGTTTTTHSFRENSLYAEILVGTRGPHYQYGIGFGIYYSALDIHDTRSASLYYPASSESSSLYFYSIPIMFDNRIYFIDKKINPFMLIDIGFMIPDVLKSESYRSNYYVYNDADLQFTFGGGVEIKTNKKYNLQLEAGILLKNDSRSDKALLHTGVCMIF